MIRKISTLRYGKTDLRQRDILKKIGDLCAPRHPRKDEIILTFKGPRVKIERLDDFQPEVVEHLFNVRTDQYLMAREPEVRTNHFYKTFIL